MKALLRLSFAVSIFYSVALGANLPDLPPEIRHAIGERVTAHCSATLRLTSKEHLDMFPHPLSPIEIMLAVCDTDRFLHCQRKVDELLDEPTDGASVVHEGIPPIETKRMYLIQQAIQKDVPWAAVALLQGRIDEYTIEEDELQFYLNTFEEYLKKKGDNLVVYQLLFEKLDRWPDFLKRALLLACKYGNQYMVYQALNRLVSDAGGGHYEASSAYEEAVAGRHKVIVEHFHQRYPRMSSAYLYLNEPFRAGLYENFDVVAETNRMKNHNWAHGLPAYPSDSFKLEFFLKTARDEREEREVRMRGTREFNSEVEYQSVLAKCKELDSELEYQTALAKCKEGDFLECWMAQDRMEGLFRIVRYKKMLEKKPNFMESWMAKLKFEAEDGKYWLNRVETLIAPAAKDGNLWATVVFSERSKKGNKKLARSIINENIKRGVHHNILFTLLDRRRRYLRSEYPASSSIRKQRQELVAEGVLDVACKYGNDYAVAYLLTGEYKEDPQDKVFEAYVNAIESRNKPLVKYLYHWGMPKADGLPEEHKILLSDDSILWLQNEVTGI